MKELTKRLIEAMKQMPVIDAHQHLEPEETAIAETADIFTRIYHHYCFTSAMSAGMPDIRDKLADTSVSLDERWSLFSPWLPFIRQTGYVQAADRTVKELFGPQRVDSSNYQSISSRLQEMNQPGLYSEILQKRCKVEKVLNQGSWVDPPGGYSIWVSRDLIQLEDNATVKILYGLYKERCERNRETIDDPRQWVEQWLLDLHEQGARGIKFGAGVGRKAIDDDTASLLFGKLRENRLHDEDAAALGHWMAHQAVGLAAEFDMVVAVHCGIVWECGWDYTRLHPRWMIPLVRCCRKTRFDLYHAGIPWVRETAVMANQYANVNVNLVWCHQISPFMTRQFLNEWFDLVPVNKIIGFGGDISRFPEKTVGALSLARENIASALVRRVEHGLLHEDEAVELCGQMLYENPARIYQIDRQKKKVDSLG